MGSLKEKVYSNCLLTKSAGCDIMVRADWCAWWRSEKS